MTHSAETSRTLLELGARSFLLTQPSNALVAGPPKRFADGSNGF